jgi:hypothetical protein
MLFGPPHSFLSGTGQVPRSAPEGHSIFGLLERESNFQMDSHRTWHNDNLLL